MNDFTELYLHEKPVKAVLAVYYAEDETFCRAISDDIDSTYAHTVRIVSKLKDLGILETRDRGRKKMLSLTEKGRKQAELFEDLLNELEGTQDSKKGKIQDSYLFE